LSPSALILRPPCPRADPFTTGATAPVGGRASQPLGRQLLRAQRAAALAGVVPAGASVGAAPTSASYAREQPRLLAAALVVATAPAGDCPLVGGRPCMWPWPQPAAPAGALALASHSYRWHGRGLSRLLATFAVKMQQECIEQFYMIQSHHTQF
ncbi:hypothetical protein BHE74_00049976, partial [Ensete ventricosum]